MEGKGRGIGVGTMTALVGCCVLVGALIGNALAEYRELPLTFVEPAEVVAERMFNSSPEELVCEDLSKKAAQIMYDRQYGVEDMPEMSFKYIRLSDSEGMNLVLRAFDTPLGVDDEVKGEAVLRFGMYQFADCMIGTVK